ncbi:MAG: U32 family peptidase, partial [Chromatiaceae bacterium]|nr:U32 family peptidase [Chromatiaceae bacterium]
LARALPTELRSRLELIAHHHLPIFHTEYCVFARFLSSGNSYRDCGRPCETHTLHLRDPGGADHLVLADIGCRNTVFNAAAQSAAPLLADLCAAGIGHYRIELVDEPAHEVAGIIEAYDLVLKGKLSIQMLQERIDAVTDANGRRQGAGLGSLAVRVELARSAMKRPTAR